MERVKKIFDGITKQVIISRVIEERDTRDEWH
jgi:hypothetical protein